MSGNGTDCIVTGNDALVLAYTGLPVCCLVTCESLLTIVTILRSPLHNEAQYLFILSLALTDILLALASTTGTYIYLPWIRFNFKSKIMETITFGIHTASLEVTGVHMSIIAIDRYIRIAHPFYYVQKMTTQRMCRILLCAWMFWVAMTCPALIFNFINDRKCIYRNTPLEFQISNLAIILVSVIIVFVCYFKIALIAVRHKKAATARRLQQDGANRDMPVMRRNNIVTKSVKFFVTMFGVYFVFTFLPFIFSILNVFYQFSDFLDFILTFLFPVHSVLNFFICCGMDKRFLKALKMTIFHCRMTR